MSPISLSSGIEKNLWSSTPAAAPRRLAAHSSPLAMPWNLMVRALLMYPFLFERKRQAAESMPPDRRTITSVDALPLWNG
jgi:hypothetical protein